MEQLLTFSVVPREISSPANSLWNVQQVRGKARVSFTPNNLVSLFDSNFVSVVLRDLSVLHHQAWAFERSQWILVAAVIVIPVMIAHEGGDSFLLPGSSITPQLR